MSAESIPFLIPAFWVEDWTNLYQTECKPSASESRKCYFIVLQNYDHNSSFFYDLEKFNTGHLVFSSPIIVRVCLRLYFSSYFVPIFWDYIKDWVAFSRTDTMQKWCLLGLCLG